MNKQNDPPGWNERPGSSDGKKWTYGLAALFGTVTFGILSVWCYKWWSKNQIQEAKSQFDGDVDSQSHRLMEERKQLQKEHMELERREAALYHEEAQLLKARNRIGDSKKNLDSHTQYIMKERRQLQKERMDLEEEKKRVLQPRAAGLAMLEALQQEEEQQKRAHVLLKEVEHQLVERQNVYCGLRLSRAPNLPKKRILTEMENDLLLRVAKDPVGVELGLEDDIRDILKNDWHCADMMSMNTGKNGKLMWLYLKYWSLQLTMQKYSRAGGRLKGSLHDVK